MASMTIASLCDGIETVMAGVSGLYTQSYDEMTESVPQWPLLQVYPVRGELRNPTGQHSFQAVQRINDVTIHADVFVCARVNIGTDMKAVVELHDAICDVLDTEKTGNPFDVTGVQAFTYSWEYVSFDYAGQDYVGLRYVMQFVIY